MTEFPSEWEYWKEDGNPFAEPKGIQTHKDDYLILFLPDSTPETAQEAVRRLNTYDELVDALQELRGAVDRAVSALDDVLQKADAALARAGGESS